MEQAQKLAQSNPQEAIRQLTLAKELNANGPGNPAGMIADLQRASQAKNTPPPSTPVLKPAVNSSADLARKVSKLLSDAKNAEKLGKSAGCAQRLRNGPELQPGNQDAQSSTERIQQAIQNDPVAAKKELVSAIRYFYSSQFDDARRTLMSYLESLRPPRIQAWQTFTSERP